jgi:uncharacterized protein
MRDNTYIIDAVVHPFNFAKENIREDDVARAFVAGLWSKHRLLSGSDAFALREAEFFSRFPCEALAAALFDESDVDMAILHALPDLGLFNEDLCGIADVAALRDRYPGRFLIYGTVQPYDLHHALESLTEQVRRYRIDGVKLYPASYFSGKTIGWRMDDPAIAYPLFRHIHDLGIRNVAVHKTVPLGRTRVAPFQVEDVEGAALEFPDMNFHVVHAGVAFLEDTAMLLSRFPNVYANLEVTFNYLLSQPRVFAESVGRMLREAPDRVVFGDGCNLVHPRPGIEAFARFEMPEDLVRGHGFPPITDGLKADILGRNVARAHGLDLDALSRRARAAPVRDLASPWSGLRGGG